MKGVPWGCVYCPKVRHSLVDISGYNRNVRNGSIFNLPPKTWEVKDEEAVQIMASEEI